METEKTYTVLIKCHRTGGTDIISGVPESIPINVVVEKFQKESIHFRATGNPPAVTFKRAEGNGIVGAMIEAAGLSGVAISNE